MTTDFDTQLRDDLVSAAHDSPITVDVDAILRDGHRAVARRRRWVIAASGLTIAALVAGGVVGVTSLTHRADNRINVLGPATPAPRQVTIDVSTLNNGKPVTDGLGAVRASAASGKVTLAWIDRSGAEVGRTTVDAPASNTARVVQAPAEPRLVVTLVGGAPQAVDLVELTGGNEGRSSVATGPTQLDGAVSVKVTRFLDADPAMATSHVVFADASGIWRDETGTALRQTTFTGNNGPGTFMHQPTWNWFMVLDGSGGGGSKQYAPGDEKDRFVVTVGSQPSGGTMDYTAVGLLSPGVQAETVRSSNVPGVTLQVDPVDAQGSIVVVRWKAAADSTARPIVTYTTADGAQKTIRR